MLVSLGYSIHVPRTSMKVLMSFTVIIPARLASTRLPNKPLADLGGKPMVVRVAERAAQSGAAQSSLPPIMPTSLPPAAGIRWQCK